MASLEELETALRQYNEQLNLVNEALNSATDQSGNESLVTLKSDLQELIQLTEESLKSLPPKVDTPIKHETAEQLSASTNNLDSEYALFMQEMAQSGAYKQETENGNEVNTLKEIYNEHEDIEDELASLLGIKCGVYHTHKWGGQPSLYNAMVSGVLPKQEDDQFKDLQVRVMFTHPTHAEMLPCPFYLDGDCRFDDDKCRYSHGSIVQLSDLKDAIEPDFESVKIGSRILLKLKPPDDEDICLKKKSSEKYHLWHRAIVKSIDSENKSCMVKLEQGIKTGEKRKNASDECYVRFEDIFPLNQEIDSTSDAEDSVSDTEYPDMKTHNKGNTNAQTLLVEKSLLNNAPSMGEWERHTRGIGSKLMLAMGYVPGTGLGASGDGILKPVEARQLPVGKSLDHCMEISERAQKDPLKVEQRLKRLQKKDEDRNRRAYEREKERERRNVFNFLNSTIGDRTDDSSTSTVTSFDIKQSSNKDLNIEQFKITEDTKKVERELIKLNSSIGRHVQGTPGYNRIHSQLLEKNKELILLQRKEQQITKEQSHRKDKQKMTVF